MGWIIETENGSRIGWSDYADATTNQGDQPPYEQSGENAKAMAAVPDLLDALKVFMACIPQNEYGRPSCPLTAEMFNAFDKAQHATEKAEGRDIDSLLHSIKAEGSDTNA